MNNRTESEFNRDYNENMTDALIDQVAGPPTVPLFGPRNLKKRKRKLRPIQDWKKSYVPRSLNDLQGPEHLAASRLPEGFPPALAFRALAAYSLLRTLSVELRISPFTPNVFLRALHLPYPSRLLGQIHVALLRVLLPSLNMGYTFRQRGGYAGNIKRRKIDGHRLELRAGDNLTYLDSFSWPLFYDDYVHLTADVLHAHFSDSDLHMDHRLLALRNELEDEKQVDSDDEKTERMIEDSELVIEEVDDAKEEEYSEHKVEAPPLKISRSRFGLLPTRATKMQVEQEKSMQREGITRKKPPHFLSRRRTSKRVEVDQESSESDNDQNDFDDEHEENNEDDEYPARLSRKKLVQPQVKSRKRKVQIVSNSRVHDVEEVENGVWYAAQNALAWRAVSTAPSSIFKTPQISNQSPFYSYEKISPQKLVSSSSARKPQAPVNPIIQLSEQIQAPLVSNTTTKNSLLSKDFAAASIGQVVKVPVAKEITGAASRFISGDSTSPPQKVKCLPHFSYGHEGNAVTLYEIDPASALPYGGIQPSLNFSSMPTPSVHPFSVSCPLSLQASLSSRPIYLPKVVVPRFKLDARKPNGIPIPVAIADAIHNFIKLHQDTSNATHPSRDDFNTESVDGCAANQTPNAPSNLPLQGDNPYFVLAIGNSTAKLGTPKESTMEEVRLVIAELVNKVSVVACPLILCSEELKATSTNDRIEKDKELTTSSAKDEVRLILEGIIDKIDCASPSHFGSSDVLDEEANEVIASMNSFFERTAKEYMGTNTCSELPTVNSSGNPESFNDYTDNNLWPQFDPIKPMRHGTPYHRLPLEQKLQMMEFLIDELLAVDVFAAEFTRRHLIGGCYSYPYGAKPSAHEFESLENGDDCVVCGHEGDLLCCDGCPRSYHRKCLSISERTELPPGKWLCPECEIVDSANFGSLRGGKKATVDWFTIDDVQAIRSASLSDAQRMLLSPLQDSNVLHEMHLPVHPQNSSLLGPSRVLSIPQGLAENSSVPATELLTKPLVAMAQENHCPTSIISKYANAPDAVSKRDDISANFKFLVVHGFVFAKKTSTTEGTQYLSAMSSANLKSRCTEHGMMSQSLLLKVMKKLGQQIFLEWPLNQVPHSAMQVWGSKDREVVSATEFFKDADRFDPSRYLSQYRVASVPNVIKTGSAVRQAIITNSDFESECGIVDTRSLSNVMDADMSRDANLVLALSSSTSLFNPYRIMVGYMERLELSLRRALLLNEFWGTRNKQLKVDIWTLNIRKCQSITKLATLLVRLVDAIHPRAFVDDWNAPPNGRVKNDPTLTQSNPDNKTRFLPMAEDWSAAGEKRVRKWQRCPMSSFLSLLASETNDLDGVIDGVCEHFRGRTTQRTKKRKLNTPMVPGDGAANAVSAITIDQMNINQSVQYTAPAIESSTDSLGKEQKTIIVASSWVESMQEKCFDTESLINGDPVSGKMVTGIKTDLEILPDHKVVGEERAPFTLVQSLETEVTKGSPCSNTVSNVPKQSMNKKTRRSGRRKTTDGIYGPGGSPKMASIIEDHRRERLAELENFLKIPLEKEGNWPVAGRKLFEPAGLLSPSEMRYLGRNAGIVPATNVMYLKAYEVGQVGVSQIWRKRVLNSISLEDLVIQIRVLDSFLDKTVCIVIVNELHRINSPAHTLAIHVKTINSCEGLARRVTPSKSGVLQTIECCQRDSGSGIMQYFVVEQGKKRGCWFSAETVDLFPLVLECAKRVGRQRQLRNEKLIQQQAVTAAKEKLVQEAIAAQQKQLAASRAAQKAEQVEQARKKLEAVQSEAKKMVAAAKRQKTRESQKKIGVKIKVSARESDANVASMLFRQIPTGTIRLEEKFQSPLSNEPVSSFRATGTAGIASKAILINPIQKLRKEIESVLANHSRQTSEVLFQFAKKRRTDSPRQEMNDIRRRTMHHISIINKNLRAFAADNCNDDATPALLIEAESKGRENFQRRITIPPATSNDAGLPFPMNQCSKRVTSSSHYQQSVSAKHVEDTMQPRDHRRISHHSLYNLQRHDDNSRSPATHYRNTEVNHSKSPFINQVTQMQQQNADVRHFQPTRAVFSGSSYMPLVSQNSLEGFYPTSLDVKSAQTTSEGGNHMFDLQQQQQQQQQQHLQQQQQQQQQHLQQYYHHQHQMGVTAHSIGHPPTVQLNMSRQQEQLQRQHYFHQYQPANEMYGMQADRANNSGNSMETVQASITNLGGFDLHLSQLSDPTFDDDQAQIHNQYPHWNNPNQRERGKK